MYGTEKEPPKSHAECAFESIQKSGMTFHLEHMMLSYLVPIKNMKEAGSSVTCILQLLAIQRIL